MIANIITFSRLLIAVVIIGLFGVHRSLDLILIATLLFLYALDVLDGYIARKRNETSELGKTLDSVVDRIIENTFWIYFAIVDAIPVWVPIFIMGRCFIKDSNLQQILRVAKSGWTHAFIHSRFNSPISCTTQMLAFTSLACRRLFDNLVVEQGSLILVTVAIFYYFLYIVCILFELILMLRNGNTGKDNER